ncbi:Tetraspanin-7 [Channa argus]|uniref:Tetraspanin n=1 Tax=Channa argus TaxID=215402 RepID=A0A6G1QTC4_CHAAH|nr:Tetraspanin-7 [Channa argus]KAK2882842.1 hypothetical protein Q8A73_021775 [Channa argus]
MGKINGCLKCIFIFFNVLFALLGCLMILGAVRSTAYSTQMSTVGGVNLGWSWVFAIGILGVSTLGIYAVCSEKPVIIKIFAGFMGFGMIIMLIFGIVVAVSRNKVRDGFQDSTSEVAQNFMKDDETRLLLDGLQSSLQCCGISSAEDWGNSIPESCECRSTRGSFTSGCKPKPQGASGPEQIYAQTCSEFIYGLFDTIFSIAMGMCFGFAVTALLGLLISLLMIHQVKNADMAGASMAMKGY